MKKNIVSSQKPKIFVLTAAHNNISKTKLFLKSVRSQKYKNYRLVFVDDGSTDGTGKYIKQNFPEVILLKGDGNLWWGGSMYLGINEILKLAENGDQVLIINNDTEFKSDYFSRLISEQKKFKKTIIGSIALDSERKDIIWDGGVKIDWQSGRIYAIQSTDTNIKTVKLKRKNIEDRIDTLSTKGTLYPIKLFKEIGNFDKDRLPHYFSDYELGWRAKNAGYNLVLDYNLKVYNDIKTTGIGEELKPPISFQDLFSLLFSRRSRINIADHFQFITICCPAKYKLKNYFIATARMFYLISLVYPFYYFHVLFDI